MDTDRLLGKDPDRLRFISKCAFLSRDDLDRLRSVDDPESLSSDVVVHCPDDALLAFL